MSAQFLGIDWNDSRLEHVNIACDNVITSNFTVSVISLGDLVGWTLIIGQAVAHVSSAAQWQSVPGILYKWRVVVEGSIGRQAKRDSRQSTLLLPKLAADYD